MEQESVIITGLIKLNLITQYHYYSRYNVLFVFRIMEKFRMSVFPNNETYFKF